MYVDHLSHDARFEYKTVCMCLATILGIIWDKFNPFKYTRRPPFFVKLGDGSSAAEYAALAVDQGTKSNLQMIPLVPTEQTVLFKMWHFL